MKPLLIAVDSVKVVTFVDEFPDVVALDDDIVPVTIFYFE